MGEIFIEGGSELVLGLAYIPTRDVGNKSRTDSGDQSAGTYTAKAELDNVVQFYADIPFTEVSGYSVYGKFGVQHATIKSLESLNSGSTYPDKDVYGFTIGLGTRGDLEYGNNLYYKAEATYTQFEDYTADSNSSPALHDVYFLFAALQHKPRWGPCCNHRRQNFFLPKKEQKSRHVLKLVWRLD